MERDCSPKFTLLAASLISPENGAATDNTPEFEWSAVDDPSGVSYEIQYSNGDIAKPDFEISAGSGAKVAFGGGRFMVAWSVGNEARAKTFDASGDPINGFTIYSDPSHALTVESASFTDGKFFVSWTGYASGSFKVRG
ncbi:MAG: hypothetical protein AB1476_00010 [Candidatus Hadarchaeota archaeon]